MRISRVCACRPDLFILLALRSPIGTGDFGAAEFTFKVDYVGHSSEVGDVVRRALRVPRLDVIEVEKNLKHIDRWRKASTSQIHHESMHQISLPHSLILSTSHRCFFFLAVLGVLSILLVSFGLYC